MNDGQWWAEVGQWQQEIETHFDAKPIPLRTHDWSAVRKGYEPGNPVGWGATEQEAIKNLLENEE